MNWADSKHAVNSGNPSPPPEGNPEPSQRNEREGVETRHGATLIDCSGCGAHLRPEDFYKKDRSGRRDSTCKRCRIIRQRERTLGVTDGEYWALYRKQSGKCGICRRRLYSKRYKAFCVDHSHVTGEIRGLLCHNCNGAIGMLRDCPATLARAAAWVEGIVHPSE